LDFGCGLGYFAACAKESGYRVIGVDSSPEARNYARAANGIEVVNTIAEAHRLYGPFNLVTCFNTLEHLTHPRETIGELAASLRSSGIMSITVPNLSSVAFSMKGAKWYNIVNPTHVVIPSFRGICLMLREFGLTPKRVALRGGYANRLIWPIQYLARLLNVGSDLRVVATMKDRE